MPLKKQETEKQEHKYEVIFTGDWPPEIAEAYKRSLEKSHWKSRAEEQKAKSASADEKARSRKKRDKWDPDITIEFKCSYDEWCKRLRKLMELAIERKAQADRKSKEEPPV